jgi:hypothetical protein
VEADVTTGTVRPLKVREGARFSCAGDGLCCMDIHSLGPLGERDVALLSLIAPGLARRAGDHACLRMKEDGSCVFLGEAPGGAPRPCGLHGAADGALKPVTCRRFPYGLTATPSGGRITTFHCCPCRTMGAREAVTAEAAEPCLRDRAGRLSSSHRVGAKVWIGGRSRIAFDRWEREEAALIARLLGGEAPERVLDRAPFPRLAGSTWRAVGEELVEFDGSTRLGVAHRFFGDALLARHGVEAPPRERPWAEAFDRAERRSRPRPTGARPSAWADYVADWIWAMLWTGDGSFERCRHELATRLALGRDVERRLLGLGARPDRAEAEAITITDLVGTADAWPTLVRSMTPR